MARDPRVLQVPLEVPRRDPSLVVLGALRTLDLEENRDPEEMAGMVL